MNNQLKTFLAHFYILLYAVRATEPFTNSDIREVALDRSISCVSVYLSNLVAEGFLEKLNCTTYQATPYAKELMGVKQI